MQSSPMAFCLDTQFCSSYIHHSERFLVFSESKALGEWEEP
jgi:hypothetical protein